MASIDRIKASDGSGNANVATVQNTRTPLSSTIVVNTVAGINATFMGSMGTPHTFTDPITSETITVISEATCVDFAGHVDGANLEIDTIAPGYSDLGSAVGDIVVIRPTTQYADNIASVLNVAHNDSGSIKNNAVVTAAIADDAVTAPKLVGIDKSNLTTDSLPYKFSVYQTAAFNFTVSDVLLKFDTKLFDTNTNYATGTGLFTAPVAGFYQFNWMVSAAVVGVLYLAQLQQNAAIVARGTWLDIGGSPFIFGGVGGSMLVQAAANDTFGIYIRSDGTHTGQNGAATSYFNGFLVSRT